MRGVFSVESFDDTRVPPIIRVTVGQKEKLTSFALALAISLCEFSREVLDVVS